MPPNSKSILNPNLLYEDKIQSPRLKDVFHGIDLVSALNTKNSLTSASSQSSQLMKERGYKLESNRFIGFYIPLDSYLPLPEPYNAEFISINADLKTVGQVEINVIKGCTVKVEVNGRENQCRLSVVLASVNVPKDISFESVDDEKVAELYKRCIFSVNKIISAYKLTPLRHNHDLGFVTIENRDSNVQAIIFELGDEPIKEKRSFEMQSNSYASIVHSRTMEQRELNYFRDTHSALSSGMTEAYEIVQNIITAVDARCNGDFERAVILADKFGELFLRFAYFHLLLADLTPEAAFEKTNEIRNMKSLVNKLAQLMKLTASDLKFKIQNETFESKCRKVRNDLNHNFLKFVISGEVATDAIEASIRMVCAFCDLLEGEDTKTNDALGIFKNTQWLIEAHKAGK